MYLNCNNVPESVGTFSFGKKKSEKGMHNNFSLYICPVLYICPYILYICPYIYVQYLDYI